MPTQARSVRSNRTFLRLLVFLGVVLTGIMVASAVFAGWTTIYMTNGTIDTTWGTANYTEANDSSITEDRNDLKNAWYKYDGTNIYFRIETWGSPALSSSLIRAVGAIDCNNNGIFNDRMVASPDGDRLVVYDPAGNVTLYAYNSQGILQGVGAVGGDSFDKSGANIEWLVPLHFLYPSCRGSTSQINIAWSIGQANGTVIDQSESYVALNNPMDYGDTVQTLPAPPATCAAPDTATGLQCNGARHGIVPMTPGVPLRLGSEAVDADPGNLQNADSTADDASGTTPDDEAGIAPDASNSWSDGAGVLNFQIIGAAYARLGCWIDFNKNGVWTDPGETVVNNATINSATTTRGITIPPGLTFPNHFPARCRIWQNPEANTPTPVPAPNGAIEFGEVEDHIWSFDASGNYIPPSAPTPNVVTTLAIAPSGTNDVKLTWTNPSPNDGARVLSHLTDPYFVTGTEEFIDTASPWEWTDTGHYAVTPVETIYYIVLGRVGSVEAAPSNRVGLFEFGLTQGVSP